MKKILALFLTLMMVLSSAAAIWADEPEISGVLSFTEENPLYASDSEDSENTFDFSVSSEPVYATNYTTDKNAVVTAVRQAMVQRKSSCSIGYKSKSAISQSWFDDLCDRVFAETSNPKEGDYLNAHYEYIDLGGTYSYSGGYYYNNIEFDFGYRSTASQEAAVDKMIPQVLEQIHFKKWMSNYDKIQAIYDWVRNNVEYDYDHDENYRLQYTAYAALVDKKAVCSGYSALFYRLARAAGFDVRIVTGSSQGEAHAWNLIKLGSKYYYVDPTWDSGLLVPSFFMKGYLDFEDHTPDSPFVSSYNISKTAYDIASENSATRGSCGPMARWVLANDKTLIIYGTGMVNDISGFAAHKKTIEDIYIYDTVSGITVDVSFSGFIALKTVSVARKDTHWGLDTKNDLPSGIKLIGYSGNAVHTYAKKHKFTFEQYVANPFYDVEEVDYYYKSVIWAINNGITSGKDATHFAPKKACTRAEVVTFLWRAMGKPNPKISYNPFVDVEPGKYYYEAVLWAYEKGITAGVDSTHFAPNNTVKREEFVTFLWRLEGKQEPEQTYNVFTDVKETKYYYNAILWAVENGVTSGKTETTFGTGQPCQRAQVVTFLYRGYVDPGAL